MDDCDIHELTSSLSLVKSHLSALKSAHRSSVDSCLDQERRFHQSVARKREELAEIRKDIDTIQTRFANGQSRRGGGGGVIGERGGER